jgi:uncharacterized protein (TIGR01777 family)
MTQGARSVITGGTGMLGRALGSRLPGAVVLSRDPGRTSAPGALDLVGWEPENGPAPASALAGAAIVWNLAGEPVATRWTDAKKRRIRASRVTGTRNLVAGLAALADRPRVLVSASAIGYYGDRGDEELTESSGPGDDFLADVCTAWEREAMAAEALGVRVVCVRLGLVLAKEGGALARMLPAFRLGAGGPLAGGKQWVSWVHIDDAVRLLLHAAECEGLRGPVNVVSPRPVTNADLSRALGRALGRPASLPTPRAALRIAFGEMSEMLVASQRVLPRAAESTGFAFEHADLDRALADLLAPG